MCLQEQITSLDPSSEKRPKMKVIVVSPEKLPIQINSLTTKKQTTIFLSANFKKMLSYYTENSKTRGQTA